MPELDHLLKIAIEASLAAGKSTLKYYYGAGDVRYKEDNSPVTKADLESNEIILKHLGNTDLPVLSRKAKKFLMRIESAGNTTGWWIRSMEQKNS
jgi:3'(2'), 5'-bisphosphate nucleotidase